jgi:hypothetical protein
MPSTITFVDFETSTGEELTLEVHADIDPFVPGKTWGDPDSCYPPEGGFAELEQVLDANTKKPVELSKLELDRLCKDVYETWESNMDDEPEPMSYPND